MFSRWGTPPETHLVVVMVMVLLVNSIRFSSVRFLHGKAEPCYVITCHRHTLINCTILGRAAMLSSMFLKSHMLSIFWPYAHEISTALLCAFSPSSQEIRIRY